jgi:hypothetical protein
MTEAEWLACEDPMKSVHRLIGTASERKLRLAASGCCRLFTNRLYLPITHAALDLCERQAENPQDEAVRVALAGVHQELLGFNCHRHLVAEEGSALRAVTSAARPVVDPGIYHHDVCFVVIALLEPTNRLRRTQLYRLLRDIFGNPSRPVAFSPEWRTDTAVALARTMYESRDFSAMPILADALQDAGCDNADVLNHCRDTPLTHVRGCWVVDLVSAKE